MIKIKVAKDTSGIGWGVNVRKYSNAGNSYLPGPVVSGICYEDAVNRAIDFADMARMLGTPCEITILAFADKKTT